MAAAHSMDRISNLIPSCGQHVTDGWQTSKKAKKILPGTCHPESQNHWENNFQATRLIARAFLWRTVASPPVLRPTTCSYLESQYIGFTVDHTLHGVAFDGK